MLKNIRKKTEGFTIIEVLIVLAIAGLILLIVFLAVPALQRNSRNTQRKNDISSILAAASEYSNNNQGKLPATATGTGTFKDAFTNTNAKLGYYTDGSVKWTLQTSAAAPADSTDLDVVQVVNFAKCDGNSAAVTGATQRSIVAVFSVEGSGGNIIPQCQES